MGKLCFCVSVLLHGVQCTFMRLCIDVIHTDLTFIALKVTNTLTLVWRLLSLWMIVVLSVVTYFETSGVKIRVFSNVLDASFQADCSINLT